MEESKEKLISLIENTNDEKVIKFLLQFTSDFVKKYGKESD